MEQQCAAFRMASAASSTLVTISGTMDNSTGRIIGGGLASPASKFVPPSSIILPNNCMLLASLGAIGEANGGGSNVGLRAFAALSLVASTHFKILARISGGTGPTLLASAFCPPFSRSTLANFSAYGVANRAKVLHAVSRATHAEVFRSEISETFRKASSNMTCLTPTSTNAFARFGGHPKEHNAHLAASNAHKENDKSPPAGFGAN